MANQRTSDVVFGDMLQRLEQLSKTLTQKERELVQQVTKSASLEKSLSSLQNDLAAARDEIGQEALRASLLEQRLQRESTENSECLAKLAKAETTIEVQAQTLAVLESELGSVRGELDARFVASCASC
jgi:chromosome segregation ATPase